MNVWTDVVVPVMITVMGGGGVLTAVARGWIRRPVDQATAAQILIDGAVKQVNELQERVEAAERSTERAHAETNGLRAQVRAARSEAEQLALALYDLRMTIFRPGMTIDQLRELLNTGNLNGRGDT